MRRQVAGFVSIALLVLSIGLAPPVSAGSDQRASTGPGDATVVAVLDYGLSPYHWDFLASRMPQHRDGDPSNDLPLDEPPDRWLPGFPQAKKAFATYEPVDLTLEEKNGERRIQELSGADLQEWLKVKRSTQEELHYYWMPGTKVIGAMSFGSQDRRLVASSNAHGVGTTSSAVGNLHGTCPECLLFFIELGSVSDSEWAIEWAMDQPWIDAISNSYGFSLAARDRLYSGSDVEAQRKATLRGQTIFFSAGNGQDGAFVMPNTTSFSSQEGPDWIVTVGAISPGEDNHYYESGGPEHLAEQTSYHASYSGHGKPADVAGIGNNYPTAYYSETVGGTGAMGFGGTSNATPQLAGTYTRALYMSRVALGGASRLQHDGVIAVGNPIDCGAARPDCELGDGSLTGAELRARFFYGAMHTEAGMTATLLGAGQLPPIGEDEFLNEGHGSYFGLETGERKTYEEEFLRIIGPLMGRTKPLTRPEGEREWMIVDSFCRQHLWGAWSGGYYIEGKTDLPGRDSEYPIRSLIEETCLHLFPPV